MTGKKESHFSQSNGFNYLWGMSGLLGAEHTRISQRHGFAMPEFLKYFYASCYVNKIRQNSSNAKAYDCIHACYILGKYVFIIMKYVNLTY